MNVVEIRTSDLYFAAYLKTVGLPFKTERQPSNKVYFIFDTRDEDAGELKAEWFNNTGQVTALEYAMNVKSLKALCMDRDS
jgi:Domain of unknown function (DUF5659)